MVKVYPKYVQCTCIFQKCHLSCLTLMFNQGTTVVGVLLSYLNHTLNVIMGGKHEVVFIKVCYLLSLSLDPPSGSGSIEEKMEYVHVYCHLLFSYSQLQINEEPFVKKVRVRQYQKGCELSFIFQ